MYLLLLSQNKINIQCFSLPVFRIATISTLCCLAIFNIVISPAWLFLHHTLFLQSGFGCVFGLVLFLNAVLHICKHNLHV